MKKPRASDKAKPITKAKSNTKAKAKPRPATPSKALGKSRTRPTAAPPPVVDVLGPLVAELRDLIRSARHAAARAIDTLQVLTNFEIGRRIVEHEQAGARRAEYGAGLLDSLSDRLTDEFGKGFTRTNLQNMRLFFLTYRDRCPEIRQQAVGKLAGPQKRQQAVGKLAGDSKRQQPVVKSTPAFMSSGLDSAQGFPLSWTHYLVLLPIKNSEERRFYEIEAAAEGWSVPELRRQKASALYERLALSRDRAGVRKLATEGQVVVRPEDLFKEPYVLEFLGLDEKATYSESDLEQAIINRLELFLLELGKGFLFEARQKRFTFDDDHFFVDLVFYNRLLRCYVLIDLKLDKLTHQDLGQMQMYVNWYDRHVRLPDENPTVGLLLCKSKKDAIVRLTLPPDANIHAREYNLYLPSKELLQRKLIEWTREEEDRSS
jgi:predicted nuclease of restriction endonuclease-like (RecB) superfamily